MDFSDGPSKFGTLVRDHVLLPHEECESEGVWFEHIALRASDQDLGTGLEVLIHDPKHGVKTEAGAPGMGLLGPASSREMQASMVVARASQEAS